MEVLTNDEMEGIVGGGWIRLSNGDVVYVPDVDEEGDDDDIIFG